MVYMYKENEDFNAADKDGKVGHSGYDPKLAYTAYESHEDEDEDGTENKELEAGVRVFAAAAVIFTVRAGAAFFLTASQVSRTAVGVPCEIVPMFVEDLSDGVVLALCKETAAVGYLTSSTGLKSDGAASDSTTEDLAQLEADLKEQVEALQAQSGRITGECQHLKEQLAKAQSELKALEDQRQGVKDAKAAALPKAREDLERGVVGASGAGTSGQADPAKEVGLDWTHPQEASIQYHMPNPDMEPAGEKEERPASQQLEAGH
nr:hypothetical protein BaRGS_024367 [Batillaria attramentaria]